MLRMSFACVVLYQSRPVTSLGHQEGQRIFREGPKFFELFLIFFNYVQHIFPGGAKKFLGGFVPPGYGSVSIYEWMTCV